MAERSLRSKKTGKVMTESELFKYDPMGMGSPAKVYDTYMQTGDFEPVTPDEGWIPSAGDWGKSLVKNATEIGMGLFDGARMAFIPGTLTSEPPKLGDAWDSAKQGAYDRYGNLDNVKRTVRTDPVGVLSDVATLAGGVSGGTRLAGKAAKLAGATRTAEGLAKTADVIKKGADFVDPLTVVTKLPQAAMNAKPQVYGAVAKGLDKVEQAVPTATLKGKVAGAAAAVRESATVAPPNQRAGYGMYRNIVAPKVTGMSLEEFDAIGSVGVQNELRVNRKGLVKGRQQAEAIEQAREIGVDNIQHMDIDVPDGLKGALEYRRSISGAKGTIGENAIAAADKEIATLAKNYGVVYDPSTISVSPGKYNVKAANEGRKATNRVTKSNNYDQGEHPVSVTTLKAGQGGIVGEIDKLIPDFKKQGVQQRDLYNIVEAIENHVKKTGSTVGGESFYAQAQMMNALKGGGISPSALAGFMRTINNKAPGFMSRIAIAMGRDHTIASRWRSKLNALGTIERLRLQGEEAKRNQPVQSPPMAAPQDVGLDPYSAPGAAAPNLVDPFGAN